MDFENFEPDSILDVFGLNIRTFTVDHGYFIFIIFIFFYYFFFFFFFFKKSRNSLSLGFQFGEIAYISDVKTFTVKKKKKKFGN